MLSTIVIAVGGSGNALAGPPGPLAPGVKIADVLRPLTDNTLVAEAYSRQVGISEDEALRRLQVQRKADGLQVELRSTVGGDYAGQWFDADTGDVVVALTGRAATDQVDGRLAMRDLLAESEVVSVGASLADLEAAHADINRLVNTSFDPRHVQTGIDIVHNAVTISLGSDATQREHELAEQRAREWAEGAVNVGAGAAFPPVPTSQLAKYRSAGRSVKVNVVQLPGSAEGEPSYCDTSNHSCNQPLRGAVRITGSNGTDTHECSAGFMGYWWNNGIYPYLMTAGHCVRAPGQANIQSWQSRDPGPNQPGNYSIGTINNWRWGDRGTAAPNVRRDIAIIPVNYSTGHWNQFYGMMSMWGWSTGSPQEWIVSGQDIPAVGRYGCRSGQASNFTCGSVISQTNSITTTVWNGSHTVSDTQTNDNMFIVGGACSADGDSGGPFIDGGTALGILAGTRRINGGCDTFYSHVYDVGYYFGVWVWTS